MIVLSGASLVLPDRILSPGTLIIEGGRIAEIRPDAPSTSHRDSHFAFHGHYIVPGFIDVHVHGIEGVDSLDAAAGDLDGPIAAIAARLPKYGVTAFCPTTVACGPRALRRVLDEVRRLREEPPSRAARVLPAHLESNFINPEYGGAQPAGCLRSPRAALGSGGSGGSGGLVGLVGLVGFGVEGVGVACDSTRAGGFGLQSRGRVRHLYYCTRRSEPVCVI
jgi:N-acetylglucosamine-6-phosphate deacetylase